VVESGCQITASAVRAQEEDRAYEVSPFFGTRSILVLQSYSYPGSVRELENMVEHAVLMARGRVLMAEHFPARADNNGKRDSQQTKSGNTEFRSDSGPGRPLPCALISHRAFAYSSSQNSKAQSERKAPFLTTE
jgi:transcriptional regulator with AAA-type ATPase domain